MSLTKRGLSDSAYYLIANIGYKVLAFLIIPILAKSVGVKEFATYDLFLVVSSFIDIVIVLGIDSGVAILLAESNEDDEKLSFYYLSTLIISSFILFIVALIVMIIFIFVDNLFLLSGKIWVYIILYVLFNMITYHTFNFLKWRARAKEASFITLFSYVIGMLSGIAFLYFNSNIESYLQGLVVGLSVGSIISLYISKEYIFGFKLLKDYKERLKELFAISLPFVPSYLGNSLIQMADRVVILMLFSKYELGLYAIIIKLAMIPQVLIGTVAGGFTPVMLTNYEKEDGRKLIKNFYHIYLILIPVIFFIGYFVSDFAVKLFGGEEYLKAAYLLPLALASILFVQSTQANGFGYVIKRKTHYIMYITFLTVALNYLLSLIFGYIMGLAGVIFGTLIAGVIRTVLFTHYSEILYSFNYSMRLIFFISSITVALSIYSVKGSI